MSALPTLLVIDDDDGVRTLVRYAVEGRFHVVGEAGDGEAAIELTRSLRPNIVLIDMEMPLLSGTEATRVLSEQFPETAVVVISAHRDFDKIRAAMTAGAKEFVYKPFDKDELLEVLERTAERHRERRRALARATELPGQGIWCFMRPTGGVGQTSLLLSMARDMLKLQRRVLVVDLEPLFGNAAFYLGTDVRSPHLGDLLDAGGVPTDEAIEAHVKTPESGISVLAPPTNTMDAHGIDLSRVNDMVGAIRDSYDYVLVDMPQGMPEAYLSFLDEARYLFPCADGSYGAVKNLGVLLSLIEVLEYPPEKIRPLILNYQGGAERQREINSLLTQFQTQVYRVFPRDQEAAEQAVKRANTIPEVAPRSLYAAAVQEILADLLNLPTPPQSEGLLGGFFGRIFGGGGSS